MPGWNDGVKYLRDEALSWHHFWKINGRPRAGHIFERLHNCENVKYVISHSDVINAVSHLKKW